MKKAMATGPAPEFAPAVGRMKKKKKEKERSTGEVPLLMGMIADAAGQMLE